MCLQHKLLEPIPFISFETMAVLSPTIETIPVGF
jgi:hypothetical protein